MWSLNSSLEMAAASMPRPAAPTLPKSATHRDELFCRGGEDPVRQWIYSRQLGNVEAFFQRKQNQSSNNINLINNCFLSSLLFYVLRVFGALSPLLMKPRRQF